MVGRRGRRARKTGGKAPGKHLRDCDSDNTGIGVELEFMATSPPSGMANTLDRTRRCGLRMSWILVRVPDVVIGMAPNIISDSRASSPDLRGGADVVPADCLGRRADPCFFAVPPSPVDTWGPRSERASGGQGRDCVRRGCHRPEDAYTLAVATVVRPTNP